MHVLFLVLSADHDRRDIEDIISTGGGVHVDLDVDRIDRTCSLFDVLWSAHDRLLEETSTTQTQTRLTRMRVFVGPEHRELTAEDDDLGEFRDHTVVTVLGSYDEGL